MHIFQKENFPFCPIADSSTEYEDDGGGYASEPNTNTEFFNQVLTSLDFYDVFYLVTQPFIV